MRQRLFPRLAILLGVLCIASDAVQAVPGDSPATGLVVYYDFENNLNDTSSLYTNGSGAELDNLTPGSGAARYVAGQVGSALAIGEMAGDPAWLDAPETADLAIGAEYSIECWVYPTLLDESWQRLILRWQGVLHYHFALRLLAGNWTVSLFHAESGGGQPNANGGIVSPNEWHHIAGVADGTMLRVYLDGVEVDAVPYDGTANLVEGTGLGVGDMNGGNGLRFNGWLDEVALWNVALTPAQIASHFDAGPDGYGLDLICSEDFDSVDIAGVEAANVGETVDLTATLMGVDDGASASYSWELVSGEATLGATDDAVLSITPTAAGTVTVSVSAGDGVCQDLAAATHSVVVVNAGVEGMSPESGLLSYWSFDEDTTDDVAANYLNHSGVSNDNLTAQGGTSRFSAGTVGNALAVGEQGGDPVWLNAPASADIEGAAIYTIEMWVFPTDLSGPWQRLFLRWGAPLAYHFAIRNDAGAGLTQSVSLFHGQGDGGTPNANGGTVVAGEWQHIAGVADGTMLRVYLNGVEVDAVAYDGTIGSGGAEGLGLGDSQAGGSGISFNGLLDEVAFWNVALTPEELLSHYEAGASGYGLTEGCIEDTDAVSVSGDRVATVGQAASVVAELSGVDDGASANYSWELVSGDATLGASDGATLNVTPNAAGTIVVAVTAGDGVCDDLASAEFTLTAFLGGAGESPLDGLVSYWSFDDSLLDLADEFANSASTALDDLTELTGAVRYEPGLAGGAVALGITPDDPVTFTAPDSTDVELPGTYSIEAWILPTELSDSWQRLVLRWGGVERNSYHFAIKNNGGDVNAVSLFHGEAAHANPNANGGTVVANVWQHVAGVADGSMLRVYLNGIEVGAAPYDGTIATGSGEGLGIGDSVSQPSTIRFNGLLDELAIWNVALTPEQILSHYNAGPDGYGLTEGCRETADSVSIEGATEGLSGTPVLLTAVLDGVDPSDDGPSHEWSVESGTADIVDNGDGTVSISCQLPGEVVVRVTSDDGACPDRGTVTATHTICCEQADSITIEGPATAALDETVVLTAVFEGNDGPAPTIEWELISGVVGMVVNEDGTLSLTCADVGPVVVRASAGDGVCSDDASAEFTLTCEEGGLFHRGDANDDGLMNITDAIFLLDFLFQGGTVPSCVEAANSNDDAAVDISDSSHMLNFLFLGGPAPPSPGPPPAACGSDPAGSPSDLGCESYTNC